jgi:YbbR domain-containing protein
MTERVPQKLFLTHILRKIFLEDWAPKLLALVITFALWLGVTGLSTPTTKRLTVPLNLNISSNAQVMNVPQQDVQIEISGDKRKIEQIRSSDLIASLDLTEMKPGDWVVSLSPDTVFVPLPQGVKLVDVAPGRIPINIEAVEEKDLEVRANPIGTIAAGYEIYNTIVLPSRIRVRGPASVMKTLEFVQTDGIDIADRKEEFTARQIAVTAPDPRAAVLNTVVDVIFRIGEKRVERSFTIPVAGDKSKTASFVIYGPRTPLMKVRADDLKAEPYLDDNGEEAVRVVLPNDLENVVEIRRLRLNQ